MFNRKNELLGIMQGFNALNMLYVSYHYYTNPEALLAEDGLTFISSLINFYALSENKDVLTRFVAQYTSAVAMGGIFSNVTNGTTQVPEIFNLYQGLILNPANIMMSLFNLDDAIETEENALTASSRTKAI